MNNKGIGLRGYVILAVLILSGYSLWPSIQLHTKSGEEKLKFAKENPKVAAKAVNFGLDLAGGTNIVLEIDKSGLKPDEAADIQERSLEIVRNRVDQFGLSEPQITPSGDSRIIAELAGVEADAARNLVGGTALLEFKMVAEKEKFSQALELIDSYLKRVASGDTAKPAPVADTAAKVDSASTDTTKVAAVTDSAKKDSAKSAADTALLSDDELLMGGAAGKKADTTAKADTGAKAAAAQTTADKARPFTSYLRSFGGDVAVEEQDVPAVRAILEMPAVLALIPRDVEFAWGRGFETVQNGNKLKKLYMLKHRAEMDGKEIATASPYRISDGLSAGQIAVSLKFKGLGPKKFSSITGNNVGKQMAIVLDNQVMSAPVIRDRIPNGEAQITGLDDMNEAKQLSVVLRAGALPAPMNIVELRNVGAGLGEENIRSGFFSALAGTVLSLIFFILYYHYAGFVANIGMMVNLLMIGAVLSMFNATLTLPGIAGAVLTAAMSLDANVIIYERIREEQRAGQMARAAVAKGYEKAFSAILDSNLTTFLTAFILYKIGTGPVKGFGLTLMIGLAVSMFSALTVTRAIFDFKLSRSDANTLNVGKGIAWFNTANVEVIKKSKSFMVFSAALIVLSIGSMLVKGFEYSIDFTGGVVYSLEYKDDAAHSADLEKALGSNFKEIKVRKMGGTSMNQYMVSIQTDESDAATVKAMRAKLDASIATVGSPAVIGEDVVGPTIGKELRTNAIMALVLAMFVIGLYIWARFGKLGMGFGAGALVSLVHDTIITVGCVSLFGLPIDGTMVAAILTMIGYSINDTIVVYDRIRENTALLGKDSFDVKTNMSINQSFARTVITSMTTLFVCAVLAVMGGSSIRDFGIVMLVGVVVGTYSSICVSAPFVVWWAKRFKRGV
jgi:SecD/SecF fusion protein